MRIQQFDYAVNILDSILWQYNEATNLLSLLNQKQEWLNTYHSEYWNAWFNDVFALASAKINLFGTAVWAIILGVPLYVPINPESLDKPQWGFNAYDPTFPTLENTYLNFMFSNFSNTRGEGNVKLTLAQQVFLLRLRYYDLTTRGDIIDINAFLHYLCETSPELNYSGTIYCLENYDMQMTYVFTASDFPPVLLEILGLNGLDILPRPSTVGERIIISYGYGVTWGFNAYDPEFPTLENTNMNFENGNFFNGFVS